MREFLAGCRVFGAIGYVVIAVSSLVWIWRSEQRRNGRPKGWVIVAMLAYTMLWPIGLAAAWALERYDERPHA